MALKAVRILLGILLAAAAATFIVDASRMVSTAQQPMDLLNAVSVIVCSVVGMGAYYVAFFRCKTLYKGFRVIVGAAALLLAAYLVATGAMHLYQAFHLQRRDMLTAPVSNIVLAAVVLAVFYFGLVAHTAARRVIENIFSIPELMKKIGFTVLLLCIYRIGYHIPLPGLNQEALAAQTSSQQGSPIGQAMEYFAIFTGGNLQQCTLFGLGIMPYISASIIFQLLATVLPSLERLQKEGQAGYRKIQEYSRYTTVVLCLFQAALTLRYMHSNIYPQFSGSIMLTVMGIMGLTAGTVFLMWLGEQIDEYGIGNGISLIIMAGIVARLPVAVHELMTRATLRVAGGDSSDIGIIKIIFLIASFIFVVSGSILITQAQRRIPIQQAKQTRGRRVYGGQRQYLPLRVNHGGVMPIIFASSLLIFPGVITQYLSGYFHGPTMQFVDRMFRYGSSMHELLYVALIFFFAFFWTTVQFRPKDMSEQLRDMGHFIPGLRPGRRTAEYLEKVMERITYCGAGFLAVIAVLPQVMAGWLNIPFNVSAFLGGTGLLIMVSVGLDLVQRIEANLVMRNYGGFLGESGRIRGSR